MTKKQLKKSNKKPAKRKKKKFGVTTLVGISLGVIICILGAFLDNFVLDKWNIDLRSRKRYGRYRESGGIVIIFCMIAILTLIIVIVLKRIHYKQEKIDLPTWKAILYGSLLGIILIIIVMVLCIIVAIVTS